MSIARVAFAAFASIGVFLAASGCRHRGTGTGGEDDDVAAFDAGVPHAVTFADVSAGRVSLGDPIFLDVVLLPSTIVHTSETRNDLPLPGSEKYLMLALPADAAYLKTVAEIRAEVEKLQADVTAAASGKAPGKTKAAKAANKKPANLEELVNRHDELLKKLQAIKVDATETIAVELNRFDTSRMRIQWEVAEKCTGGFCPPTAPTFKMPEFPEFSCVIASDDCIARAEEKVTKLAALDPPDLDQALPKLPTMSPFDDPGLIARFNKLVPRFNKEVERRSAAVSAVLPAMVDRLLRGCDAIAGHKWTIRGTPVLTTDMAMRIYQKSLGGRPTHQIRENPPGGVEPFSTTTYAKTRYCIASQPVGADILVNGASSGKAPACFDALVTGQNVDIRVELPGRAPAKVDPAGVRASPANLTEVDCILAKDGSAGTSACKIVY